MAAIAGSCPMTASERDFSIPTSFSAVVAFIFSTGTPLMELTVAATSSSVASTTRSAWASRHFAISACSAAAACFIASRYCDAASKSPRLTAASFLPRMESISPWRRTMDSGLSLAPILSRAPVSSMASIALSGS